MDIVFQSVRGAGITRFLMLKTAIGPVQRLVVGGVFGFLTIQFLWLLEENNSPYVPLVAVVLIWVGYCFDAARFADAALPRWLAVFTVIVPAGMIVAVIVMTMIDQELRLTSHKQVIDAAAVAAYTKWMICGVYIIPVSLLMAFLPSWQRYPDDS